MLLVCLFCSYGGRFGDVGSWIVNICHAKTKHVMVSISRFKEEIYIATLLHDCVNHGSIRLLSYNSSCLEFVVKISKRI